MGAATRRTNEDDVGTLRGTREGALHIIIQTGWRCVTGTNQDTWVACFMDVLAEATPTWL